VQCLEDRDELVAAGKPSVGGVALQEGHPVLDPAAEEVLARSIEARSESIPSTRTFAYARAFSMLEQPCPQAKSAIRAGWIGEEPFVDLGNRRKPLLSEQVLEQGPREGGLGLVQVVAVVGVGHAVPLRNASSTLSTGRIEARTAAPSARCS
jgi:hypothetical protein